MDYAEEFAKKFVDYFVSNHISFMSEDFSPPCQIILINENFNHTALFITKHDPDSPHLQITVITTKSIEETKTEVDNKVLKDPYWLKSGYAIAIAATLSRLLRTPTNRGVNNLRCTAAYNIFKKNQDSEKYPKLFKFCINFEKTTVEEVIKENGWMKDVHFGHKKESDVTPEKPQSQINKEEVKRDDDNHISLVGTLWYPPIVFKDQPLSLNHKFILDKNYKGHRLMFDNQSMIFITSPLKEPSESFAKEAAKMLNEIIAVAQMHGIDGSTVSINDIVTYKYEKSLQSFSSRSFNPNSSARSLIVENIEMEGMSIYEFENHLDFQISQLQELNKIIILTEKISQNRSVSDYLLSFLDAKTHYLIEQYKTSFLLAWTIIEKYIDGLWEDKLTKRKISNKRMEKLTRSNLWTADDKLETLNLMDVILDERFEEIKKLKKIRNDTVHNGQIVTKREAEECLRLCVTIIKKMVYEKCFLEL